MKKFLNANVLAEYVESICDEQGLSDNFKEAMLSQVRKLRDIYGDTIPKSDFLEIFGQQKAALQTGYKKQPVDIEEFILGTEYLNLENTIRPKIKSILIDLFDNNPQCYEVVLGGATRWGKTYLTCVAFCYHVYKLSCLYNPQTHYKLSPGSEIIFAMQSVNEKKANRNFREMRGMVTDSSYFKNHFKPQGKAKNYLVFPYNIVVKPVPANNTAVMSENVFAAFIDEANFMDVIKGSVHQGLDEQYYDQATKLYQTVKDRIQNQFKDFETGEWPGKLYLASSANHKEDFIQTKKKEAETSSHIYVADYPLWEVKPGVNPSGRKFWVQMPTELDAGKILEKRPKVMTEDIIEVPIELKDQFDADLYGAIRNVAGKPISRSSKFIPQHVLVENIESYNTHYNGNSIFSLQEVNINEVRDLKSLLNLRFIETINNFYTFHTHCDLAVSQDSAGIGIGAAVGAKTLTSKEIYDIDTGEKKTITEVTAPIYSVFGLLRITPPEVGQIDLEQVRKLYMITKEFLTNLNSFTADYAYSINLLQSLKKVGIKTSDLSLDRRPEAHFELKNCLVDNRCWVPENEKFKEEVKNLYLDTVKNKVDHHALSSKDVVDGAAGVVYTLSKRKASWRLEGQPHTLKEMRGLTGQTDKKKSERPRFGARPSSKNRPSKWQRK